MADNIQNLLSNLPNNLLNGVTGDTPPKNTQTELMSQLNSMVQIASQNLLCGPGTECSKEQEEERLQRAYSNAKTNKKIAPQLVDETAKEYYTFTKGTGAYHRWREKELEKEAQQKAKEMWYNFQKKVKETEAANETLKTLAENENNVADLNIKYEKELTLLRHELQNKQSVIATNDRKSVYEKLHTEKIKIWYRIFLTIYGFVAFGLFLALFLVPNNLTIIKKIICILFLIVFPYSIDYIMYYVRSFFIWLKSFIPKDVYL